MQTVTNVNNHGLSDDNAEENLFLHGDCEHHFLGYYTSIKTTALDNPARTNAFFAKL